MKRKNALSVLMAFSLGSMLFAACQPPEVEQSAVAPEGVEQPGTEESSFMLGEQENESRDGSAPAIPREPPRADRISFGPLDELGEAIVTGAPGAVLPSANVLLVNVDTQIQDYVISEADGSFSARLFAPPGSFITIKHGPDHRIWEGSEQGANQPGLTIFPSTTMYRPHTQSGDSNILTFADAGSIGANTETIPTSVGAAWSISGTVGPVENLHPGDAIAVEATLRLYSQAINSSTDVSAINFQMGDIIPWLMLYDQAGQPLPPVNQAGSTRLTPGGFPILDNRRPMAFSPMDWQPVNWQFIGGNTIEGELAINMILAPDLPPGIYRPVLNLEFSGVPASSEWLAAIKISFTFSNSEVALPPLEVKEADSAASTEREANRLVWHLLMDHASLGTRGTGAREDQALFQPSSFVATQGAPYVLSPVLPYSGAPATYRLEPYLPMITYGRGAVPGPPLLPFKLPGGELCVAIQDPDGQQSSLGCDTIAQSVSGDESTFSGELLNLGSVEVGEYYGLTTASDRFLVSFVKPGHYVIQMQGWVEDVWGNRYEGGGTYDVFLAHPIDIDPGLLPGTPLAAGEALNPTVQLQPRLPAKVNVTIRHFPDSDPDREQVYVAEGFANRFGYFAPHGPALTLDEPGEYRVDLTAQYQDPASGEFYMGSATWGSVVMSPGESTQLVARGRRGMDNLNYIPNQWFILCELDRLEGTPHIFNTYLDGDIIWSRLDPSAEDGACLGDALVLGASVQDTVGAVETAIQERFNRNPSDYPLYPPMVPLEQRAQADELPLFSSTFTGHPVSLFPGEIDQIAYAYLSSQRPGVRVRESVAEDGQGSGYWRFDSMYDNQPGVGLEGDLANDFKYQFVGVVYRDLASGLSEYLGQASGWVHLPENDATGSRVMPPFSGPGNGGWTTSGGPLMILKGKEIHMFILPTGVRPGSVLQVGDRFDFAGHLMPTLDSRVEVEVTDPSGQNLMTSGRANEVGYFYAPEDSFELYEPGRWTVRVRAWHDGKIGSGEQVNCDPSNPFDPQLPCPSGDVLGSADGMYAVYVVPAESPRLTLTTPGPGRLTFDQEVAPIVISGPIPEGVGDPVVHYTISMPGFLLEDGQAQIDDGQFSLTFDPVALHADFPNLDLIGRHGKQAGLADTFSFGFLLTGELDGQGVYRAATLTIQGDQVYVESADDVALP